MIEKHILPLKIMLSLGKIKKEKNIYWLPLYFNTLTFVFDTKIHIYNAYVIFERETRRNNIPNGHYFLGI